MTLITIKCNNSYRSYPAALRTANPKGEKKMKILFVIGRLEEKSDDAHIFSQSFIRALTRLGHQVRILSTRPPAQNKYTSSTGRIPPVSMAAHRQGIPFDRPKKKVLLDALQWADVVHFQLPFRPEKRCMKIARQRGIATVASFCLQPENIICNMGLGRFKWLSALMYRFFRITFYRHFTHIICPSSVIAHRLIRHGYGSKLHIITKDAGEDFTPHNIDRISAGQNEIDGIIQQTLAVYREAIKHRDWYMDAPPPEKTDRHVITLPSVHKLKIDQTFNFVPRSILFHVLSRSVYLILVPLLSLFNRAVLGVRVQGRENLRSIKGGLITVSNHIHIMDCTMIGMCYYPRMCYFTSAKNIFEAPVVRRLVRMLGGIPIPDGVKMLKPFAREISGCLARGRAVHFYPETALWPYYKHLRPFKAGAFHLAADNNVPIVPIVLTCRPPTGIYLLWRIRPLISIKILEPVYPDKSLDKRNRKNKLKDEVFRYMNKVLESEQNPFAEKTQVLREQLRQYGM